MHSRDSEPPTLQKPLSENNNAFWLVMYWVQML